MFVDSVEIMLTVVECSERTVLSCLEPFANFTQLQHYVHFYHMQKILYPQSKETTLSIHMTTKTVRLFILKNQNEQLHRELKNTPEL